VIEIDERALANVNTRMELIEAAVADWAASRDDVQAAVVVGSHARSDAPADRWSDLDVILIVDDPGPYATDARWVAEFGAPALTFLEPTAMGEQRERRVLYETGEDVDLPLIPLSALDRLESSDSAAELLRRGYRILVDKIDLEERLRRISHADSIVVPPGQRELTELASDFWYHALWTAKKLRRGEVFTAIECLDAYMKGGMHRPSILSSTPGTAGASSNAGPIRARSQRWGGRTPTTTCAMSRARSGRPSISSRVSRRRPRVGSGSRSSSITRT